MIAVQYLFNDKKGKGKNPIVKLQLPDNLGTYLHPDANGHVDTEHFFRLIQRTYEIEKGLTPAEEKRLYKTLRDPKFAINPKPGQRKSKYRPILANSIHDPHVIAFNKAQEEAQTSKNKSKKG